MSRFANLLLCSALTIVCIMATSAEVSSDADCEKAGFIRGELKCSTCDKLSGFGLNALKDNCENCCTQDKIATRRTYPKAILEVCTCKFRTYPQIQAFIKSDRPAKFPNLKIKYVRGLDPFIKLLDKNSNVLETLSIAKWNTDTVEEFFETHLDKNAV